MLFAEQKHEKWAEAAFFAAAFLLLGSIFPANALEIASPVIQTTESEEKPQKGGKTVFVLGLSWHSGFCETRPKLRECGQQKGDRVEARQFSLHGLWTVGKSYCGVPDALKEGDKKRKWLDMPELVLSEELKVELARAMPGTLSGLDRHEWIKHGTCSGDVAAGYYARSLKLLAALNGSEVQALFQGNLGKELDQHRIQEAFDVAFGPGAGERVRMRCAKDGERRVITGLTIGLGDVEGEEDLGTLIAAASPTKFGCGKGVVDEAGPQ